jgi:acyl-CoA thioester hydrolase
LVEENPNGTERSLYRSWVRCTTRYGDLDPNGHINNGAINSFFEEGRVQFRRDCLSAKCPDVLMGFVVAHFSVDYLLPLGYPSSVDVGTSITEIGRTSFHLSQGIFQDTNCIAMARAVAVHVDPRTGASVILSPELRAALETFLVAP